MPVSDDEGDVIGSRQQPGGHSPLALVGGTVGAQRAKGNRVGAALGGEAAPEAEHVRPGGQPQVGELGELAEAETFGDVAASVVPDGQLVQAVGGRDARRSSVPVHLAALVAYLATYPATVVSVSSPADVTGRMSS